MLPKGRADDDGYYEGTELGLPYQDEDDAYSAAVI